MSTTQTELRLLTITEVAQLLRISKRTAWDRVWSEGFPEAIAVGSQYRWVQHEVHDWISRQRVVGRPARPQRAAATPQPELFDVEPEGTTRTVRTRRAS